MTDKQIQICLGDITKLEVDIIVNAANSALCGGGGVDGAIHRAAGPGLLAECRQLTRLECGQVVLTGAHNLKASYVIHAVGPVWYGGHKDEEQLLANCYANALKTAAEQKLSSIAFPAISCGAYSFPLDKAALIAFREVTSFLADSEYLKQVILCCFDERYYRELKAVENSS